MEYVKVEMINGKVTTILKAEYEAGKDKGYIKSLYEETEQKVLATEPENKELKKQNKKK